MSKLGIVLVFAWCMTASAQEPIDGPKVKFNDPFIENLAGEWDLTRTIRGKTVKNRVKATWVLDHHFLQLHMVDVAVPAQYEALVLIGYSNADREYVAHWCDVFGGRYSAVGRGRLAGQSIEFVFQYPDGPFYNTFTWDPAARTWTMKLENSRDGKRIPFATDVLRRPN
jgi:hypothetical protein